MFRNWFRTSSHQRHVTLRARRSRPAIESLEDRCVPAGAIMQFPIITPTGAPFDITSGPKGYLWFTEPSANKIGSITPAGVVAEYAVKKGRGIPLGIMPGLLLDTNGVWFAEAGGIIGTSAIERMDTTTGAITDRIVVNGDPKMITGFVRLPLKPLQPFIQEIWYTDTANGKLGMVVPGGKSVTRITLGAGTVPWGITLGDDGGIWFTEAGTDRIGRLDPTNNTFKTYKLPSGSQPRNITARADGVWFTEDKGNQIGTLDYQGNNYKSWTVPTAASHPWGIAVGPDNAIWFTESSPSGNNVGRLDGTGTFEEISIPTSATRPQGIAVGSDGNIWFTESAAGAIGRVGLDWALHGTGKTVATGEGGSFVGAVASFTDDDPLGKASSYTATIDWGNNFVSAGTIVKNGNHFDVVGNSVGYGEEGTYPVTVTVTDIDDSHDLGGSTVTIQSTMQVSDSPLVPIGLFFDAGEGQAFSDIPVADFWDTGGAETSYQVSIDWGDSTPVSAGVLNLNNGVFQVLGSHTYAEEGGYTIHVLIQDEGGSMATATGGASVGDVPLSPVAVSNSGTERAPLTGVTVATFTDAGGPEAPGNYTATIDWGDQTGTFPGTVVLSNGVFHVVGSHTYGDEGTYTVTVSIVDAESLPYYVFGTSTIADAPLAVQSNSINGTTTVTTTERAFFSGVVGSFTDAAGLEGPTAYSALIDWGDGHKSAGLLTPNLNGGYDVVGDHVYAEEGSYPIQVMVTDDGGSTVTVPSTALVTDAALSALGLNFSGTAGVALSNLLVGIFSDAGGPENPLNYTVSIDWGDNTPVTVGQVQALGTLFKTLGNHTYAHGGIYTVAITITDDGGATITAGAIATINPGPNG
jgi:streptogramin lyase